MSYILVPAQRGDQGIQGQSPGVPGAAPYGGPPVSRRIRGGALSATKDSETPDAEYRHGWGPNDGQRVEAAGAANLGRAIVRQADTAEARQNLLASWNAWRTEPADSEADRRNGDRLQARLREFGEFLQSCGGLEIW